MLKQDTVEIIDVNEDNVAKTGFFCYMSKRQTEGYRNKLCWLKDRFSEGMKIKMLGGGARGFIEYIPGEYAWRAVNAEGFMLIHCLWVVGKCKGKGYGKVLLDECINDARKEGQQGVAVITSEGNYLVGKKFFLNHGFEAVDTAPPSFNLLVKKFKDSPDPAYGINWDDRLSMCSPGLTVFRTHQCPYIEDSVNVVREAARERGIPVEIVELTSSRDVRSRAPSPYGVFSIVYNGRLLEYWPVWKRELTKRLDRMNT